MLSRINIRTETAPDYNTVNELISSMICHSVFSIGEECKIVTNLRKSHDFINELSLVAEVDEKIVGHILFSKLAIKDTDCTHTALAMWPVTVIPEFRDKIAYELINNGHIIALRHGFESVIVLGYNEFYSQFNYKPCSFFSIWPPFDLPNDDLFMAKELVNNSLINVSGFVVYPNEFNF